MDKRTEDLKQLKNVEQLLQKKAETAVKLQTIEREIANINQSSERGVDYQQWYPTNNAEKEEIEIEKEVEQRKKERLEKFSFWIVLAIVCPIAVGLVITIIGIVLSFQEEIYAIVFIVGLVLAGLTYPLCTRHVVNAKRRVEKQPMEWTQNQIARKKLAEERDAQNTQLNYQKKAFLDAELRKRNEIKTEELQPQLEEIQRTYDQCCAEIDKLDVLGREDMNLYTVGQLIRIIESHRADNISTALLVYDEQQARLKVQRTQEENVATTRAMARQMAEAEEQRREEQYLRDQKEMEYRRRMEELAQLQISELEKQRGEMEKQRRDNYDYQRINDLENAAYRRRMEELAKEQVEALERKRRADNDYRKYGRIENN